MRLCFGLKNPAMLLLRAFDSDKEKSPFLILSFNVKPDTILFTDGDSRLHLNAKESMI